jgi:hypothetical protein
MFIRELYQDKAKRDMAYKELKSQGRMVHRRTTGPQLIHPQYVADFTGPEKYDTGLGNMVYKTYFKNLYVVEGE